MSGYIFKIYFYQIFYMKGTKSSNLINTLFEDSTALMGLGPLIVEVSRLPLDTPYSV